MIDAAMSAIRAGALLGKRSTSGCIGSGESLPMKKNWQALLERLQTLKAQEMCLRKVRYATQERAEDARKMSGLLNTQAFQCVVCKAWHLGKPGRKIIS